MEITGTLRLSFRTQIVTIYPGWDSDEAVKGSKRIEKALEETFESISVKSVYENAMQSTNGKKFEPVRRAIISVEGIYSIPFKSESIYHTEMHGRRELEEKLHGIKESEPDAYTCHTFIKAKVMREAV